MPRIPHRIAAGARLLACLALGFTLVPASARALVLPPGFVDEPLPFTFVNPTNIRFLPDGRPLITEKRGRLYMVDTGNTLRLLWSGEASVLDSYDRGLLAVAVDPTFPTGRWIYLLHSVDPDSDNVESNEDNWGRLMRMQMNGNNRSLNTGTRQILFGTTWADGPLDGSQSHSIGGLNWGSDGSLLVTVGDGAHFSYLDPGGYDAPLFAPGMADPSENIGAFRARDLQSLNGKVLRIDPATGLGLPSNPFWDGNGTSRESKVWAYGLRNPFRFTLKPGTGSTSMSDGNPGTIYYGDVGWDTWEEFGVIRVPGSNMGWPCYEGEHPQPQYQAATPAHDGCVAGEATVMPLITLNHSDPSLSSVPGISGSAAVGGVFYTGTSYPPAYQGGFFIGDYPESWIKVMRTDDQDQLQTVLEFATEADNPVAFATNPVNGDVYFVSISSGIIHHIRFTGGTVGVPAPGGNVAQLEMSEPRPNPSHGAARFGLQLPKDGMVTFEIFDAQGRIVWSAPPAWFPAGPAAISWPGTGRNGGPAGNGLYFARARMDGGQVTRKFVMSR